MFTPIRQGECLGILSEITIALGRPTGSPGDTSQGGFWNSLKNFPKMNKIRLFDIWALLALFPGGPGDRGAPRGCTFWRVFNNSPTRDKTWPFFWALFGVPPERHSNYEGFFRVQKGPPGGGPKNGRGSRGGKFRPPDFRGGRPPGGPPKPRKRGFFGVHVLQHENGKKSIFGHFRGFLPPSGVIHPPPDRVRAYRGY